MAFYEALRDGGIVNLARVRDNLRDNDLESGAEVVS
jgi:hypothetical protein